MADGTTDAPAPPLREKREMVSITLTDKYDSYRPHAAGPQFNAGESVAVPKDEAERMIALGAAVRHEHDPALSTGGKAPAHPPNHKMQTAQSVK